MPDMFRMVCLSIILDLHDSTTIVTISMIDDMLEDDAVIFGLEPFHRVSLGQLVGGADLASFASPVHDIHAGSAKDHVEVHTVDANAGVILDTQIDVFLNTEPEVGLPQLVLAHLEATLKDFLGLWASDGAVHGDLFVTPDTERSDSVTGLGKNWGLTSQRLQNLSGSGESVSALANTDVQTQFPDLEITHRILTLVLSRHFLLSCRSESSNISL